MPLLNTRVRGTPAGRSVLVSIVQFMITTEEYSKLGALITMPKPPPFTAKINATMLSGFTWKPKHNTAGEH